jgi:hypothetical protein
MRKARVTKINDVLFANKLNIKLTFDYFISYLDLVK